MKYIADSAKIHSRRVELDLSKTKLSARSGVSVNTIYALENNHECNPTIDTLGKVCEVLGLEIADVVLKVSETEGGG